MLTKGLFDKLLWLALFVLVAALVVILVFSAGSSKPAESKVLDKALERAMTYQSRVALIRELYGPVETLLQAGQDQSALLKLAEIEKTYPGEAHGQILKGGVLARLGAIDEAVASYATGVKLRGDYVDKEHPLSRRTEIGRVVEDGLRTVSVRLAENPDNRTARATRQQLYYLQSRLAGGCE
jgi:cytochrome c-type biogenesis protein CcmH/NrfG